MDNTKKKNEKRPIRSIDRVRAPRDFRTYCGDTRVYSVEGVVVAVRWGMSGEYGTVVLGNTAMRLIAFRSDLSP